MAGFARILLLLVCIAFAFVLGLPTMNNAAYQSIQKVAAIGNATNQQSYVVNITAGVGPISISNVFPNPYSIFKDFVNLIITFATIPYDTFTSIIQLPPLVQLFLIATIGMLAFVYGVGWWKGNDPSA